MKTRVLTLALSALCIATAAEAQFAPSFLSPQAGDDIGVYLNDAGDLGIEGIWRQTGNLNLGVRFGYIDMPAPLDAIVGVGVETWDMFMAASDEVPVDVAWTLGVGAQFGDATVIGIPVGLSVGRQLDLDQIKLNVYGHPRIGLFLASVANNTDMELDAIFDIGADALITDDLTVRVGISLGDIDTLGIGLAYRWSRGAVVR